jgi:hypothetical protein
LPICSCGEPQQKCCTDERTGSPQGRVHIRNCSKCDTATRLVLGVSQPF